MGSDSDWEVMSRAADRLAAFGIPYEARVLSAHRSPEATAEFARTARDRGYRVFICGAGLAAHLAGAVSAHTTLPVLAVPLDAGGLGGLDALLATVQMPAGIPVGTLAVGRAGAENAAILAAQILALADARLAARMDDHKRDLASTVAERDRRLQASLGSAATAARPPAAAAAKAQVKAPAKAAKRRRRA
jgi:5-(carboxyamino)imidazole ribonucleotide mutase